VSLQNEIYRGTFPQNALIEDFKVIYDGHTLVVAASSPLDQRPYGVYDARDRFKAALSSVCEFEEIPPCLTHQSVVLFNKGELVWRNQNDVFIDVDSSSTFLSLARELYLSLIFELNQFYECCYGSKKIMKNVSRVHELESLLINDLKKFLATNWGEFMKKRRLAAQSKKRMVEILDGLSAYGCFTQALNRRIRDLDALRQRNSILNELISKISETAPYDRPRESLDVNASMRLVEHVRREIETYVTNTSTLLSALAGAIIGSILTLAAIYLQAILL
jgi:hypothetical protein